MTQKLFPLLVLIVSALIMTAYEVLKDMLFPSMARWSVYAVDIAVVSCGFFLFSYFFQKKTQAQPAVADSAKFDKQQWLAATLFDNLDDAVIMTDKDNQVIAFNSAFSKITDESPGEILGKKPKVLAISKYTGFYDEFWNELSSNGQWQGEIWNRDKKGDIYVEWFSIKRVYDEKGEFSHHIGVFSDITPGNASFERIQHLMHYDVLTELPNKTLFFSHLQKAIANAMRDDNLAAVLCLKIDKFEQIVKKYDFEIVDELLQEVSVRLREIIQRKADTISVSRTGGDEFVVLLAVIKEALNAMTVAEHIREVLNEPFEINEETIQISVSIGVAIFPEHGKDENILLTYASEAVDEARFNGGGNRVRFYQKLIDIKPII